MVHGVGLRYLERITGRQSLGCKSRFEGERSFIPVQSRFISERRDPLGLADRACHAVRFGRGDPPAMVAGAFLGKV